jgi:hypothetical protein
MVDSPALTPDPRGDRRPDWTAVLTAGSDEGMAMLRILLSIAVLCGIVVTPAASAAAYETWCADDPIVSIGGQLVDIQVQMPVAMLATMRSTSLTVTIPRNVSGAVVVDDVSAFPMKTEVEAKAPSWSGSGPLPVTIVVTVESSVSYEIRVVATPVADSSALSTTATGTTSTTGTTNSRLVMSMTLGR